VARPRKAACRIYADTSVFGGCFDPVFERPSLRFFESVRRGSIALLLSSLVRDELEGAPAKARKVLASIPAGAIETVPISDEVMALRDAYLAAGIVGPRSQYDATHVAAAAVSRADAIVSWNFKHIVSHRRVQGYNSVNLSRGYGVLRILPPGEVLSDDEP
jgi:hypothetical protein